jgi:hypothetical protein
MRTVSTNGEQAPPSGRRRPPDVSDETIEALGKASEAVEYVERARGHLYSLHQLIGRADLLFEEAAEKFAAAGLRDESTVLLDEIVGRNVLDGRWTFQIVEEFDDCYYQPVSDSLRQLERRHVGGARHVFEEEMKERRRSAGRSGHERRPPDTHLERPEA